MYGSNFHPDIFVWFGGKGNFATPPSLRQPSWRSCAAPIIILEKMDLNVTKSRLGSVIREILIAQPNRRYIPSLVFTQKTVEYMMWDRSGAVCSTELNYRTDLVRFYNVIIGMIRWSPEEWGFDVSMRYTNEGSLQVLRQDLNTDPDQNFPIVEYHLERLLLASYNIRSRGSTRWQAYIPTILPKKLNGPTAVNQTLAARVKSLTDQAVKKP
jgi:hypothetical protein